jgi:predicted HTH transcriptional regulator
MANNAKVTTPQLQNQLSLSDGRIRKLLIELAKKNLIKKVGDNRYAHYVLTSTDE